MKKILIFTLIFLLSCSQAESFVNERDNTQSVSATPSAPPVDFKDLEKEIKILQTQIKKNTETLEEVKSSLENKFYLTEKMESGELCDFGECKENPFIGQIFIEITDSKIADDYRGIIDIENRKPFVKVGTVIEYHYSGSGWMDLIIYHEKAPHNLMHIKPDGTINCTVSEEYNCGISNPSALLISPAIVGGGGGPGDKKKGGGDSYDIESYSCAKPNTCVVDFIKNGFPTDQIDMDFVSWNATEFFFPKVVK